MREYVSDAIVLGREPMGEADSRIYCFSEKFGKVSGRATSARKITSKLSAHLEPGVFTRIRFVEKKGVRIADAMKFGKSSASLEDLHLLSGLLAEGEPEPELWQHLLEQFSWRRTLAILGWDPEHAECSVCAGDPTIFYVRDHDFLCTLCALKLPAAALIYL